MDVSAGPLLVIYKLSPNEVAKVMTNILQMAMISSHQKDVNFGLGFAFDMENLLHLCRMPSYYTCK